MTYQKLRYAKHPTPITRLSSSEKLILRTYVVALRKIRDLQTQVDEGAPVVAKIVGACGGRIKIKDLVLELDPDAAFVFSPEVQDLEKKLNALKQAELDAGRAHPEPAAPRLRLTHAA